MATTPNIIIYIYMYICLFTSSRNPSLIVISAVVMFFFNDWWRSISGSDLSSANPSCYSQTAAPAWYCSTLGNFNPKVFATRVLVKGCFNNSLHACTMISTFMVSSSMRWTLHERVPLPTKSFLIFSHCQFYNNYKTKQNY